MFNPMAQRVTLLLFLASHLSVVSVVSRSFTIENRCEYTIWPATATYSYEGLIDTTGFMLEKGDTRIINATSSWVGNLWGRTECSINSTGQFSCITGDCESGNIECSSAGTPTATLAEFNLAYDGGDDYYDVNVMNGYNLPLLVTPENGKCKSIGCVVDIKKTCPKELWINKTDVRSNDPSACKTSCQKNQSREICCVRPYLAEGVPPQQCKRTIYSQTFNRACPGAYSYAYDTNSSTFTCPYSSNFIIQFCPSAPNKPKSSTAEPPLAPSVSPAPKKTQAGEKRKSSLKLNLILDSQGSSSPDDQIALVRSRPPLPSRPVRSAGFREAKRVLKRSETALDNDNSDQEAGVEKNSDDPVSSPDDQFRFRVLSQVKLTNIKTGSNRRSALLIVDLLQKLLCPVVVKMVLL
ncbi:hypothetical protein DY000_02034715 [Brassica cretica]|uniref:Thaumatin-like protein n=1 Tax=Brassica cretica TaxID=69181 RepID=A0ABQ7DY03_BRACR|nr:hypothetical protein DY000_02034715 [Brassica cretica]